MQLVPIGTVGEIYIGGVGVSPGYINRPDLNLTKFPKNPFTGKGTLYATGDFGRWLPNGEVECLGRMDNQVKLRGFRIELDEIDYYISQFPSIQANVTVVSKNNDDKVIVSYFVPQAYANQTKSTDIDQRCYHSNTCLISDLRGFLKEQLPNYSIPSVFIPLSELPLSTNGKVDKTALPCHKAALKSMISQQVDPVSGGIYSPTQNTLNNIWQQTLGLDSMIPLHTNFFDLGGHSILATRLGIQVRKSFGIDIPISLVFRQPTIYSMAAAVDQFNQAASNITTNILSINNAVARTVSSKHPPLNHNNVPFVFSERIRTGEAPIFFLTGATGFLGAFILAHLLIRFPTATVLCVVRAQSPEHAFNRIKSSSINHLLWQSQWNIIASETDSQLGCKIGYGSRQVRVVVGDLSQPRLGITTAEWQSLARDVDAIIHNGALVHWMYPYSKFRSPNVLGTLAAIDLATTDYVKPLHFISSLSVFNSSHYIELSSETQSSINSGILESDGLEGSRHGLPSGYDQSKWVADKLILEARARGYPFTIIRPGFVVGSSTTGVINTDDFQWRLVKGCIQLGKAPVLDNEINMCPVDYIAELVAEVVAQPEALDLGIFHIESPTRFSYSDMFGQLRLYGYKVDSIPYTLWCNHLKEATDKSIENALYSVLQFAQGDMPKDTRLPILDTSHTQALCQIGGMSCPPISSLIGLYLAYMVKVGFLTPPTLSILPDARASCQEVTTETPPNSHMTVTRQALPQLPMEVSVMINRNNRI
ncbi:male sterility protein-domain-containing protein [Dimargaris cristalligena]|uniref:Male sterility protein-domain-containing protein n=1 Tax=Dimargaris cristalligena TaxID=215637 RepID=A0A4P9ZMP4_9FUNG|nr:male sterility protein-domain-containing protein [Dimargaris cristalligena]|eukprot:RKP34503.1 male sterility protein-domain-containing protein [Dimargaris cristalligena]